MTAFLFRSSSIFSNNCPTALHCFSTMPRKLQIQQKMIKKTPSELELLAVFPQKNTHHSVVRSPQKKPRNSQSPRRGLGLRHSRHSAPAAVHSAGLGSGCRWWRPPTAPAAAPPLPRPGRSLGTGKCWRQTSTHLKTQKRGRKVGSQKKYGEIWWNMYWMTIDSKIS